MADAQACALIHFREQELLIEMEEEQKQHLRRVVEQRKRVEAARKATLRAEEEAARVEDPDLPANTPGFAEKWDAGFGPAVGAWRTATIWVTQSLNNEEEFEREMLLNKVVYESAPAEISDSLRRSSMFGNRDDKPRVDMELQINAEIRMTLSQQEGIPSKIN
jgi:hypothetical protein